MKKTITAILALNLAAFSGTSFSLELPVDEIAELTKECKQQAKDYELEGRDLKEFITDCVEELKAEDEMEEFEDERLEEMPEEGMAEEEIETETD